MSDSKFYRLQALLLEDFHSGTGMGDGDIDRVVVRDADGQPYLPATHIKGVWRDLAYGLLSLGVKPELFTFDNIQQLFGKPHGEAYGAALELLSLKADAAPKMLCWGSTAMQIDNRAPQVDTLRLVEFVPAGTRFEGLLQLRNTQLYKLLEVVIGRCDALGALRNRGAGRVRWKLEEVDAAADIKLTPRLLVGQKRLRLLLQALEPLCMADTAHAGNLIRGECYIRGQALYGALVAAAQQKGYGAEVEFLLSRKLSIGNAYPLPDGTDLVPCLADLDVKPIPLHLGKPKAGIKTGAGRIDMFKAKAEDDDSTNEDSPKAKRPDDTEFLFRNSAEGAYYSFKPRMGVRLRSQSAYYRPRSLAANPAVPEYAAKEAELFSQQEIAGQTCFIAELDFAAADFSLQEGVWAYKTDCGPVSLDKLLPVDWIKLGRGGKPVRIVAMHWLDAQQFVAVEGKVRITLLSDLLARDQYLRFYRKLSVDVLCELTGIKPERGADWPQPKDNVNEKSDTVEVRGFNAASGFNRNAALAIRRGSTLEFSGSGEHFKALLAVLNSGKPLGERTWEGFGRYTLDFKPEITLADNNPAAGVEAAEGKTAEYWAQQGKVFVEQHSFKLNKTQWQRLRHTLQASNLQVIDCLDAIAGAVSSQNKPIWEDLVKKLKAELESVQDEQHKRLFVDYVVRWQLVKMKDGGS
jgi:hypothetical protein